MPSKDTLSVMELCLGKGTMPTFEDTPFPLYFEWESPYDNCLSERLVSIDQLFDFIPICLCGVSVSKPVLILSKCFFSSNIRPKVTSYTTKN